MRFRIYLSSFAFGLVLFIAAIPASAEERWIWSGGVTPDSAVVKALIPADSTPELVLRDVSSRTPDRRVAGRDMGPAPGGRVIKFAIDDLMPATAYRYEVDGLSGEFRTFPRGPASFTVAFGSCAATGSNHPVFGTIASHEPLFFLHAGDFHYEDIAVNDVRFFQEAFRRVLTAPAQAALYRSTSIAYTWDDHDYGPNNSDSTAPGRESARRAYRQIVPHYDLPAGPGGPIHQAFTVGRVRFIMTDTRSERDPPEVPPGPDRTMFGVDQKEWLKRELLEARDTHQLIVWVNTVPWIADDGSVDRWSGFTHERAELAAFIEKHGIRNLCMISGDAHMIAIDDGSNNRYGPSGEPMFPVFQAAALDRGGSVKGGPYSHGTFPGGGQFGLMRVIDNGEFDVRVEWTGRNHDDDILVQLEFEPTPPAGNLTAQWEPVPPVVRAPAGGIPSDAKVLFDGTGFANWEPVRSDSPGWRIDDGAMITVPETGSLRTKEAFGDIQLHLEFRSPYPPTGESQQRGNSGVYFMGLYELQVLDSYDNPTYVNGQAGSIYKQYAPLVNASRPPGEWQTYDVVFIAPRFTPNGRLISPARMTVFHNGVLTQHAVELTGPTINRGRWLYEPHPEKLPLMLQQHGSGDEVAYRNIWIRELGLPEE